MPNKQELVMTEAVHGTNLTKYLNKTNLWRTVVGAGLIGIVLVAFFKPWQQQVAAPVVVQLPRTAPPTAVQQPPVVDPTIADLRKQIDELKAARAAPASDSVNLTQADTDAAVAKKAQDAIDGLKAPPLVGREVVRYEGTGLSPEKLKQLNGLLSEQHDALLPPAPDYTGFRGQMKGHQPVPDGCREETKHDDASRQTFVTVICGR